jgi:hypothetical protein
LETFSGDLDGLSLGGVSNRVKFPH